MSSTTSCMRRRSNHKHKENKMKHCEGCKFQLECTEEEKARCVINNSTLKEKLAICETCFLKKECKDLFCGIPF